MGDHASYRIHISLHSTTTNRDGHEQLSKATAADFFLISLRDLPKAAAASSTTAAAAGYKLAPDPRLSQLTIAALDMPSPSTAADAKQSRAMHATDAKHRATTPVARFEKQSSFAVDTVDVSFGIVHMFRDDDVAQQASSASASSKQQQQQQGLASNRIKTKTALEDDSGTILALLGVPSIMGPAEVLRFVNRAESAISQVRMVREERAGKCMVLLKFRDAANAEEFHKLYADRPFDVSGSDGQNDGDGEGHQALCRVVYVTAVTMSTSASLPYAYPLLANSDPWPLPPGSASSAAGGHGGSSSGIEMPTCPVCLERMDASVTGLMTVTCQHTFHCSCLGRWTDSRCPVCRYTQSRGHSAFAHRHEDEGCSICHTQADLWVCLICATAGCGRYKAGHAHAHYKETGHLFALDVETERVWDYGRDGYVHRLIQNKASSSSSSSSKRHSDGPTPRGTPQEQEQQESEGSSTKTRKKAAEEEEDEKMEALGLEFSQLVSSQLESQRGFYEDQLRSMETKLIELEIHAAQSSDDLRVRRLGEEAARREAAEAKGRAEHLARAAEKNAERAKDLDVELKAERQMSKGLVERLRRVEEQQAREDWAALKRDNEELREQVRDLMFFLDAKTKVEQEGGEEMRGGDVVVGKSSEKKKKKNKRRKGKATATAGGPSSQAEHDKEGSEGEEEEEEDGGDDDDHNRETPSVQ